MSDKYYMENLLTWTKSYCDLLLHATIESSTPNVNGTMEQALLTCLSVQNAIYKRMESKGWYQTKMAPITKIEQTAMKQASY